tara:strand:+ start:10463 stop:11716 length:1254 start_codon:yes stop_codon:yes gene_type:complete
MERLLVVEDSTFFKNLILGAFETEPGIEIVAVETMADAEAAMDADGTPFFLALVDLNLPDAPDGEVVSKTLACGIPSVVFTGTFDELVRTRFLDMGVLDFVLKDNPSSLRYLISLTRRILRNRTVTALVVDDSVVARRVCSDLLKRYRLKVIEAKNGVEALEKLSENPGIRIVITDHEMPEMDGFDLVTAIRREYDRDRLMVIGVSGSGGAPLSAKFLKHGANDFITKPYLPEELYTRVALNLDILENVSALTNAATRDFLTGLLNRRSFFDVGARIARSTQRGGLAAAVAILDIDHFKAVNDTYGHETGDDVLKVVAELIERHTKRGGDVAARFGGEEFVVMLEVKDPDKVIDYFNELRETLAAQEIDTPDGMVSVTASIGVVIQKEINLEAALKIADDNLYAAKNAGRNQVVVTD